MIRIISSTIFIFFCFWVINANSQTAIVSGVVLDKENKPLEDVTVSILGYSSSSINTDKFGKYQLTIPSNKEVTIVFYNINYLQVRKTLSLKPKEELTLQIQLMNDAKNNLNIVEILDNSDRNNGLSRLDPKVINRIPSASGDFNTILFSQPGVSTRNELSSSYSVRGGNFDENLVYVNDIEVYRPFLVRSGQQEGLSFVNPDMVSSVLFSAGGFEAKYGDKLSSVLDIQYRKPRLFSGTASGSLLGANLHLEGSSKNHRFTWIVGSRYKTNKYVLGSLETKGNYQPSFIDVQAFLTYDISEKWEFGYLVNYSNNKYQVIPENRETRFGTIKQAYQLKIYFDGQEIDYYQAFTNALTATYKPNDNTKLKFIGSVYQTTEAENADIQGQYYIDQLETDFGKSNFGQVVSNNGVGTFLNHLRNNLNATVVNVAHNGVVEKGKNRFLWGVKLQHEEISNNLSEWKYIDSAGYSLPLLPNSTIDLQEVIKSKSSLTSNRFSGYAQKVWSKQLKDTSRITLTAGVRSNYWTLNNQNVISPRISIVYKPYWKKDILLRASTGYYYQPPFFREMIDYSGALNTNLKAQQSVHYVMASDLNFKIWNRPFKFISELYYKQLKNIVPYEVDNVRVRYFANNDSKGYATGLDFKLNGEFVNGIESWASLSLLQTKEDIVNDYFYDYYNSNGQKIIPGYTANNVVKDSVKNTPGYIPRPTDQRVTFSLFFQDYLPKFPDCKMHLNLIYGSGTPFGPPEHKKYKDTLRMPPYRRVDLGFSYQILKEGQIPKRKLISNLKSVWLGLEVFNLLQINNTVSYIWITDITNRQYAIPNYLTSRQLNAKLIVKF